MSYWKEEIGSKCEINPAPLEPASRRPFVTRLAIMLGLYCLSILWGFLVFVAHLLLARALLALGVADDLVRRIVIAVAVIVAGFSLWLTRK